MTTNKSSKNKKNSHLQLSSDISRRDFVNGTLVGFGAGLLSSSIPTLAAGKKPVGLFNDTWTVFGGVGDYANSNGNVASVREAAHLIRDGLTPKLMMDVETTGEQYHMAIIGC